MPIPNAFTNPSFTQTNAAIYQYDSMIAGSARGVGSSAVIATNYFLNSGFRNDLNGWTSSNTSMMTLTRYATGGIASANLIPVYCRMTFTAVDGAVMMSTNVTGIPAGATISVRMYGKQSSSGVAYFKVRVYSGAAYAESAAWYPGTVWTTNIVSFTVGSTAPTSIAIIPVGPTGNHPTASNLLDLACLTCQIGGVGLPEWFDEYKTSPLIPGASCGTSNGAAVMTSTQPLGANFENAGTITPLNSTLRSSVTLATDPTASAYGRSIWLRTYNTNLGNAIPTIYKTSIAPGVAVAGQKYWAVIAYRNLTGSTTTKLNLNGATVVLTPATGTTVQTASVSWTAVVSNADVSLSISMDIPANTLGTNDAAQIEVLGVLVYAEPSAGAPVVAYFDGAMVSTTDRVYSWQGDQNANTGFARQIWNQTGWASTKPLSVGIFNATLATDRTSAVVGSLSMKSTNLLADSSVLWFVTTPPPTGSWLLSFWAKADRAGIILGGLAVGCLPSNGNISEWEGTGDVDLPLTTSWVRYYVTVESYGASGGLNWYLGLMITNAQGAPPAGTTVWIDGVTITPPIATPHPYVDGSRSGGQWNGVVDASTSFLWPRPDSLT